jgi:hypothetical protein
MLVVVVFPFVPVTPTVSICAFSAALSRRDQFEWGSVARDGSGMSLSREHPALCPAPPLSNQAQKTKPSCRARDES